MIIYLKLDENRYIKWIYLNSKSNETLELSEDDFVETLDRVKNVSRIRNFIIKCFKHGDEFFFGTKEIRKYLKRNKTLEKMFTKWILNRFKLIKNNKIHYF